MLSLCGKFQYQTNHTSMITLAKYNFEGRKTVSYGIRGFKTVEPIRKSECWNLFFRKKHYL